MGLNGLQYVYVYVCMSKTKKGLGKVPGLETHSIFVVRGNSYLLRYTSGILVPVRECFGVSSQLC